MPAQRVVLASATAVALSAAAALALSAAAGGHRADSAHGRVLRHGAPPGSALPAAPLIRPLRLVGGSHRVNGIYTDYPHSAAGAVSAAVEFMTELGSTLNPDHAATIARLVADRSYAAAPADAAASSIAARRVLGLAESGPLPAATGAFLVPVMYQLRDASVDRVTVLLLFDYTTTAPAGVVGHVGVSAARLAWTNQGWRLLRPSDHDLAALLATPGTASAAAKGWKAMTDGM